MKLIPSLLVAALALGACSKKDPTPAKAPEAETKAPDTKAPETQVPATNAPETKAPETTAPAVEEVAAPIEEVAAPIEEVAAAPSAVDDVPRVADFPDVALAAEVGQWVFAPTRASLDEAKKDPQYRSPSYAQAQVVEVGPAVSKVKADYGDPESIPNAYMIPIPKESPIAVGDVVLSSQYGNNMELAVVTKAGDAPEADFVEVMPYAEDHIKALKPGRYLKLDGTLRPGAHVAVKVPDDKPAFANVVNISGDKVLLAGFMGAVIVADKAAITPLEVDLQAAVGDEVQARFASGAFMKAKVTAVDAAKHLVTVDFTDLPDPEPSAHPTVHITKRL